MRRDSCIILDRHRIVRTSQDWIATSVALRRLAIVVRRRTGTFFESHPTAAEIVTVGTDMTTLEFRKKQNLFALVDIVDRELYLR